MTDAPPTIMTYTLYRETRTAVVSLAPAAVPYLPGQPLAGVAVRLVQPACLGCSARDNELETLRMAATALRLSAGLAYTATSAQRYTLTPHAAECRRLGRPMVVRVTQVWVSQRADMRDASVESEVAEELQ